MKTVTKIVVAVDFSDHAQAAVKYAVNLAADVGAELLLVNVINQRDIYMTRKIAARFPGFSVEKYLKETREKRENSFRALIEASDCSGVVVKTCIRSGVPWQELIEEIQEKKADLLVMAPKGRSNLMDTLIGSCAKKLFKQCPIPVLSVRE
jgi:nucleotide-binding universal stress UspA family protein